MCSLCGVIKSTMEIVFLLVGAVLGASAAWFFSKYKFQAQQGPQGIQVDEINAQYVPKSIYTETQQRLEQATVELTAAKMMLARTEQQNHTFAQKLEEQKKDVEGLQENFRNEFKILANDLLEEKSKKFVALNQEKLGDILTPLRERIENFEKKVDSTYNEENKDRSALKEQLRMLVEQTKQVGEDANRLASALKGDNKMQGDWGEVQLELILEKAGLQRDIHFFKQQSFKDDDGSNHRPDYVIKLPEDKHLVVDSKVSLTAYERYFNGEDELEKKKSLMEHIASLSNHVSQLGNKNYQNLPNTNQPDYVILFVPIESALSLALKEDSRIFEKALDKNVVLVSGSTLLATLRTISYMWRQENQKRNVSEIAKESGLLYDKFVGFIQDMIKVGTALQSADTEYKSSMNKLYTSSKKGDTIIGRMDRIKQLGANSTKAIPQALIDRINDDEQIGD